MISCSSLKLYCAIERKESKPVHPLCAFFTHIPLPIIVPWIVMKLSEHENYRTITYFYFDMSEEKRSTTSAAQLLNPTMVLQINGAPAKTHKVTLRRRPWSTAPPSCLVIQTTWPLNCRGHLRIRAVELRNKFRMAVTSCKSVCVLDSFPHLSGEVCVRSDSQMSWCRLGAVCPFKFVLILGFDSQDTNELRIFDNRKLKLLQIKHRNTDMLREVSGWGYFYLAGRANRNLNKAMGKFPCV